jgi:hypothetical protein
MLEFGFGDYMAGLGQRTASEVLLDFAKRGIVDPKPHLLILFAEADRYVKDQHFQLLQKLIAEKYPPLRHIHVGDVASGQASRSLS